MTFAARVFLISAVYGFIVVIPQYFLENNFVLHHPPAFAHPAFYYGFVGVALAFQFVFLIISRDPIRYRPFMLAGVVEKVTFGAAALVLKYQGRIEPELFLGAVIDVIWALLFITAYVKTDLTPRRLPPQAPPV